MKTQKLFLKRMIFASMLVAFVANNVQAMDTDKDPTEVVVVEPQEHITPEGQARQKYNNWHRRLNQIDPCITAMVRGGSAAFVAGAISAAVGALAGNKDAINVGAFLAVVGYFGVASGLTADIYAENYDSYLWKKAEAEEKSLQA